MKTIILSSAAALGILAQSPLLFGSDISTQTQLFTAAPQVAVYALNE